MAKSSNQRGQACGVGLAPLLAVFGLSLLGCASGSKKLSATERAHLHIEAAAAALNENDPTGALQSLDRAAKEDSTVPELYYIRALSYYRKSDLGRAMADVKKAIELKPDYSEANNTYGKFLMDAGKAEESLPYLQKAADDPLYRESFKPLTLLGILHYRRDQLDRARVFFERAVSSDSVRTCLAHYYLGHVALKQNKLKDAIQSYDSATRKFCVSFTDAHLALGIAYERNRDYDRARAKFLEIKQRYPETPVAAQAMERLRGLP